MRILGPGHTSTPGFSILWKGMNIRHLSLQVVPKPAKSQVSQGIPETPSHMGEAPQASGQLLVRLLLSSQFGGGGPTPVLGEIPVG